MTDRRDEAKIEDLLAQLELKDLEPITPEEAVNQYLKSRQSELRSSSLYSHELALEFFIEWCDKEGIDNLNDLSERDLRNYRIWRREDATTKVDRLSKKSEKTQQDIIRVFIEFCEHINAVSPNLHEAVRSPSLKPEEATRDVTLDEERAERIMNYLQQYEPASVEAVVLGLLIGTGARTGEIHSVDVDDVHLDADPAYVEIRHRPESGTTLKNGDAGERLVVLPPNVRELIDDYLENGRPDDTDEHGREPLLTAGYGRLTPSTIRKYTYMWTRPCAVGQGCPHGRNPDDCDATCNDRASKCPSSRSPHALRREHITRLLRDDVEMPFVSDRCNVSEPVLKQHYDARSDRERMEQRSAVLDKRGVFATDD